MNKFILLSGETIIEPIIKEFQKKYQSHIRDVSRHKGGIPKPEAQIRQESELGCRELKNFLLDEEALERIEKGFEIALRELGSHPNKQEVLDDLKNAGDRLLEPTEPAEEVEIPVYNTLQDRLGLKEETFQAFYLIASRLFNTDRKEEAMNVLIMITHLNSLVFEPWLGLGSCWLMAGRYPEALHAFTMASLLQFHHPAPHIYSAECYLALQDHRLASDTLNLAISLMDRDQKHTFADHIDYIQKQLNRRTGQ